MPEKTEIQKAREEGRRAEATRVAEIRDAFQASGRLAEFATLYDQCIGDADCTPDDARKLLLKEIGKGKSPSGGAHNDGISANVPPGLNFRDVATEALMLRAGAKVEKPSTHALDLRHMSLVDLGRACLEQNGVNVSGYGPGKIVARALSTSDFPNLLANVGEKLVLEGFQNPEVGTHRIWTDEASHRDFKPVSGVAVSETPALELIGEGGEYTYGVLEETGDAVALATYGRILAFTRQAIINDDLRQLSEAAMAFGQSAVRLEADLCYAILVANPDMADGIALFHADHNNVGTAGAPSVETLGEARSLMRLQRGLNDESYLDPQPFALIVPTALETVSEQLLVSLYDPAGQNQQTNTPAFIRRLQLVADPRLDDDSTTQWYLTANPRTFSWVKRIYLDGQLVPFIEEKDPFVRDELHIKCRHDFAAQAYMHQGAVRNAG